MDPTSDQTDVNGRATATFEPFTDGVALITAEKPVSTTQDKAVYADPNLVASVRPGLKVETVSAAISPGRTITASVRFSIPKGLPLQRRGIVTPGATDAGWIAGCIDPPGAIKEKSL